MHAIQIAIDNEHPVSTTKGTNPQMDPSALGTTIIGLDRTRRDQARYHAAIDDREPIRQPRWRSRSHLARERVAHFLHRTADHIAPSPTPA